MSAQPSSQAEVARLVMTLIAGRGGLASVTDLQDRLLALRTRGQADGRVTEILLASVEQPVSVLERRGAITRHWDNVRLTDQGWKQAWAFGSNAGRIDDDESSDAADVQREATIDVRNAEQIIRFGRRDDGTDVCGYLWGDYESLQGTAFRPPASVLGGCLGPRA